MTKYGPWFAIAFRAGQEQRLSPSCGGMYWGQTPPSPGLPLGVTWPIFRLKVSKLMVVRERSQSIKPTKKAPPKSFEYTPRPMRRRAVMSSTMGRVGKERCQKKRKSVPCTEWSPHGIAYISSKRCQP